MKKLQLSIILLLLAISVQAQYYKFDNYTEPYVEFSDGTVLTDIFSAEVITIDAGREINLFGEPIDETAVQIGKNGYVISITMDYSFAVDPLVAGMVERDATSSVSYKIDEISPDGPILKVQWKNMGLEDHDPGDFVNFQAWIYLSTQAIEFRYGESNVTGTAAFSGEAGAQVLIAQLTPDFQNFYEIQTVKGSGNMPEVLVGNFERYTGVPADGVVIRFRSRALLSTPSNDVFAVSVYPNPFNSKIQLAGDFSGNERLTIRDVNGKVVYTVNKIGSKREFDVNELSSGVYFIEIAEGDRRYTSKLVK